MAGLLAVVAILTWPLRAVVYQAVAPAVAASPAGATVAGVLAEYGPLLLVALAAVLAVPSPVTGACSGVWAPVASA